uniref:Bm11901 n=1 Tax=Brugia malayi TaxID=6279 RepID=A0A1I9GA66_BRUMA|nr:Bm11901 [Brugia malayi]
MECPLGKALLLGPPCQLGGGASGTYFLRLGISLIPELTDSATEPLRPAAPPQHCDCRGQAPWLMFSRGLCGLDSDPRACMKRQGGLWAASATLRTELTQPSVLTGRVPSPLWLCSSRKKMQLLKGNTLAHCLAVEAYFALA